MQSVCYAGIAKIRNFARKSKKVAEKLGACKEKFVILPCNWKMEHEKGPF